MREVRRKVRREVWGRVAELFNLIVGERLRGCTDTLKRGEGRFGEGGRIGREGMIAILCDELRRMRELTWSERSGESICCRLGLAMLEMSCEGVRA